MKNNTIQELENKADKCLKLMENPNLKFLVPLLAMQYKEISFKINELKKEGVEV